MVLGVVEQGQEYLIGNQLQIFKDRRTLHLHHVHTAVHIDGGRGDAAIVIVMVVVATVVAAIAAVAFIEGGSGAHLDKYSILDLA